MKNLNIFSGKTSETSSLSSFSKQRALIFSLFALMASPGCVVPPSYEDFKKEYDGVPISERKDNGLLGGLFSSEKEYKTIPADQEAVPTCKGLKGHRKPKSVSKDDLKKLGEKEPAKIVCAVDGDTYDMQLSGHDDRTVRVRAFGMDCPESYKNKKCRKKGKKECKAEVKKGKKVKEQVTKMFGDREIELQGPFAVNDDRLLAYVHVGGIDLSRSLITSCLCAEVYDHKRKQEYMDAAKAASCDTTVK